MCASVVIRHNLVSRIRPWRMFLLSIIPRTLIWEQQYNQIDPRFISGYFLTVCLINSNQSIPEILNLPTILSVFAGKRISRWEQCSMYSNSSTISTKRLWKVSHCFQLWTVKNRRNSRLPWKTFVWLGQVKLQKLLVLGFTWYIEKL